MLVSSLRKFHQGKQHFPSKPKNQPKPVQLTVLLMTAAPELFSLYHWSREKQGARPDSSREGTFRTARHSLEECNYPDLTNLTSAVQPLALHFTVSAILKKPHQTKPNQTNPLSAADRRHHLLNIIISPLSILKR